MRTAVFLYESEHVKLLDAIMREAGPDARIIASGLEIEFLLEKRGVPFLSARTLRTTSTGERLILAERIGREVFTSPAMEFFTYRGINLGRIFTVALQDYFAHFLYYLDIAAGAFEEKYEKAVMYSPSAIALPTFGVLGERNLHALPDAVRLVCRRRGTDVIFLEPPRASVRARAFLLRRVFFGFGIRSFNRLVRMLVRKKKLRILASENWKNIGPLMSELPECELTLLDRTESLVAGIRAIVRNRMQFVHSDDYVSSSVFAASREQSRKFVSSWRGICGGHPVLKGATFRGYALGGVLEEAVGRIMSWSEKTVRDIEGMSAMIERLRPHAVLVRASTSAQTHFALLCEVARAHGVPSVEVQHGLFSVGPESFTRDHAAQYIAEYGPLERKQWEKHGYASGSDLVDIGSPRFDRYRLVPPAAPTDMFRIALIAPLSVPGFWNDSYDVFDYFLNTAKAAKNIPNSFVTVKLRPGPADGDFYREAAERAFAGSRYRIEQYQPLAALFAEVDAVVTYPSTVLFEAMTAGRPVIVDATLAIFRSLTEVDLGPHTASGALQVAGSTDELASMLRTLSEHPEECTRIIDATLRFMRENYLLHDGDASRRLAGFIREVSLSDTDKSVRENLRSTRGTPVGTGLT